MPGAGDAGVIYGIGVALFLGCALVLSFGKRIVRTLEILNWVLVAVTLGGFLVMALVFVEAAIPCLLGALVGFAIAGVLASKIAGLSALQKMNVAPPTLSLEVLAIAFAGAVENAGNFT